MRRNRNHVLVIESTFYPELSEASSIVARDSLKHNKCDTTIFSVMGTLEIANAMNLILETNQYDGVVVLGCIIRGETENYKLLASECIRSVNDLAIHYTVPLGFGIICAENKKQAEERCVRYAKKAVEACLSLIAIRNKTNDTQDFSFLEYTN